MVQKKYCCGLLCMLICFILLPVFTCTALAEEQDGQKKVRVGYMDYEGYQNGGEDGVKSGSAYEYYQRVKYYTNWEYEYVYGSAHEMFDMLEKGEIDIMACVTYSEKRAEKYFFSNEAHGMETYYLYTRIDNNDITPADLSSLNGKSIGVVPDSYQEAYLKAWCARENIDCNIVTYE